MGNPIVKIHVSFNTPNQSGEQAIEGCDVEIPRGVLSIDDESRLRLLGAPMLLTWCLGNAGSVQVSTLIIGPIADVGRANAGGDVTPESEDANGSTLD